MKRPNVILVVTDDQGYGDLGCTGNPRIRTPNIDTFHDASVRFSDFHVQPLCTPTRGCLMTGRRPLRNGAWSTAWGRSLLCKAETTMADVFAANGYRTGLFGKWHLGDNFPYRPFDRGFQTVVAHRGGGVGQTPDFWGNLYFDDTYFHNGEPIPHEGYCTDVWFEEATRFVEQDSSEPFFAYLATNAPHDPYLVADRYAELYRDDPQIPHPAFYGMISNIDENFGRLRRRIGELGIENDTILIFMTDNGSSGGCVLDEQGFVTSGCNAGMRGRKGSYYDGGHRVPFSMRWPGGGLDEGRDVQEMALGIDVLPTLIDLCGLESPDVEFDGTSVGPLLRGEREALPGDRVEFLQYSQCSTQPDKWRNAVMTRRWRLVYGRELYGIKADPEQRVDVAGEHPDVVRRLRDAHEQWWAEILPDLARYSPITIGSDAENPSRLDAMDVMGDIAWHQTAVVEAKKSAGIWNVDVAEEGEYVFRLRRWPEELDLPIDAGVSPEEARHHIYAPDTGDCKTIAPTEARLKLFGQETILPVEPGAKEVPFRLPVTRTGETRLEACFADRCEEQWGAYYVYVARTP